MSKSRPQIVNDGIPEPIYMAVLNDLYDSGDSDWTPSSLMSPPYAEKLIALHGSDLKVPASSRVPALIGTGLHYLIELAGKKVPHWICERRFMGVVQTKYGPRKVGAQVDVLDKIKATILDGKTTKSYAAKGEPKDDYTFQLNVGRWCVWEEIGFEVDRLVIMGVYKDWSRRDAKRDSSYPQLISTEIELPVWSFEDTEAEIVRRVEEREAAKLADLDDLRPCSAEEMWASPDEYALMMPGSARALKVFKDRAEAMEAFAKKPGSYIQDRLGERKRCGFYCDASSACPSYQDYLKLHQER